MRDRPLISIVVPTKDRAELLKACISSIIKQNFKNFECLIIDDGSIDETKSIVESFNDARLRYYYKSFSDRSKARNFGIEQATGEYICFVDDDDWLGKGHLMAFVDEINRQSSKSEILRVGYLMHSADKILKSSLFNSRQENQMEFVLKKMCGVWSLCIPKQLLTHIKFPPGFPHWQDTYFIALLLANNTLKQLESYTYHYRIHDKMGSLKVVSEEQLRQRANINVAAMKHFFENHFHKISALVDKKLFNFLYSEKNIQYAVLAKKNGFHKLSKELMNQSLESGIHLKLWKYYIQCIINLA